MKNQFNSFRNRKVKVPERGEESKGSPGRGSSPSDALAPEQSASPLGRVAEVPAHRAQLDESSDHEAVGTCKSLML